MALSPCLSCTRLVRSGTCPFCGAAVSHDGPSAATRASRVARSALVVGVVSAAAMSVACYGAAPRPMVEAPAPASSSASDSGDGGVR
jgi:hypothetical protein